MTRRLTFLIAFGAGWVLGARSGRERYEQIAGKAQELWGDPRVQEKADRAQQLVRDRAGAADSRLREMVGDKAGPSGAGSTPTTSSVVSGGGVGSGVGSEGGMTS